MKKSLRMISLIAACSGLALASQAQTTVISQNFDALPLGAYGTAYDFSDFPANTASSIVAPGEGGAGQALLFTADILSGSGNLNCGTDLPYLPLSGNSSANLSDYTLSFDLALDGGGAGFFIAFNTFGPSSGPGFGQGVEYDIFGLPASGSGYQHFSVNMGTLGPTFGGVVLDPTVSEVKFELALLGFPPSVGASPEMVHVDNVQISMVPEPSTVALIFGGLGLLAGWRRYRRVS